MEDAGSLPGFHPLSVPVCWPPASEMKEPKCDRYCRKIPRQQVLSLKPASSQVQDGIIVVSSVTAGEGCDAKQPSDAATAASHDKWT